MKKIFIFLFLFFLMNGCKNEIDVKYNKIYVKLFDAKLSYELALKILDNDLEKKIDFKNGLILFPDEFKGTPIEEQRIIRRDKYSLEFRPKTIEIDSINQIINKINSARPLIQKIVSLSEQTTILYKADNRSNRGTKIIKHSQSDYDKMELNYQDIKKANEDLKTILEKRLPDFVMASDVNNTLDPLIEKWMRSLE